MWGGDRHEYEIRYGGDWAWMTDAPSAGGRTYINITIVDVEAEEGRWGFYDRYRENRLALARTGGVVEYIPGPGGGEGQYTWGSYSIQPGANDCLYHVMEHAYPSWNAPGEYGFVISVGICEADLEVYERQREAILGSFEEIE